MLFSAIPSYRLPREVIEKEIDSLLDENITLRCDTKLGRDITIERSLRTGFRRSSSPWARTRACRCISGAKTFPGSTRRSSS